MLWLKGMVYWSKCIVLLNLTFDKHKAKQMYKINCYACFLSMITYVDSN